MTLRKEEIDYTYECREYLKDFKWAFALIRKIPEASSDCAVKHKPLLFEVRFGAQLARNKNLGIIHEFKTDVGGSDVDFKIIGEESEYLMELASIGESDASKKAIENRGEFSCTTLTSPTPLSSINEEKQEHQKEQNTQSCEGEMILVQQKIGEKVLKKGKPIKFPEIKENGPYQIIVVDMRGYLNGGDEIDYEQICYGASDVTEGNIFYWEGQPIRGLFESHESSLGQAYIKQLQKCIHAIMFISEKNYTKGEIFSSKCMMLAANPNVFTTNAMKAQFRDNFEKDFGVSLSKS